MTRYPAFLQQFKRLGHYNEIWKLTLNPIDPINKEFEGSSAEIPKDDAKKRFEDAESAPRAAPRAEPHRDRAEPPRDRARPHRGDSDKAAGSASGYSPKAAMPSGDVPKPAQPKREFSDFERAMGREDYLDTRAYHSAMEERKQHQELKIKNIIKKYVNDGVDIYKPFGTKEEVEKMNPAAFRRKFAELANAPGEKDMELLTNAKKILQNKSYKEYYDRKVAEKASGRFRPS